eukprot:CAMPEP_0194444852 /NCGR_PEP_ID=MMETSP0176-20130528/127518_1 /TAXON_ID=216777 /ORGANISM="Proboscia alata, Strain PI-D3" /LENGTH=1756 /DNA_ID=CAMNT_0039271313 /DNA_START=267 /DNA_END=5538 /DNA_ORIENTATION=+
MTSIGKPNTGKQYLLVDPKDEYSSSDIQNGPSTAICEPFEITEETAGSVANPSAPKKNTPEPDKAKDGFTPTKNSSGAILGEPFSPKKNTPEPDKAKDGFTPTKNSSGAILTAKNVKPLAAQTRKRKNQTSTSQANPPSSSSSPRRSGRPKKSNDAKAADQSSDGGKKPVVVRGRHRKSTEVAKAVEESPGKKKKQQMSLAAFFGSPSSSPKPKPKAQSNIGQSNVKAGSNVNTKSRTPTTTSPPRAKHQASSSTKLKPPIISMLSPSKSKTIDLTKSDVVVMVNDTLSSKALKMNDSLPSKALESKSLNLNTSDNNNVVFRSQVPPSPTVMALPAPSEIITAAESLAAEEKSSEPESLPEFSALEQFLKQKTQGELNQKTLLCTSEAEFVKKGALPSSNTAIADTRKKITSAVEAEISLKATMVAELAVATLADVPKSTKAATTGKIKEDSDKGNKFDTNGRSNAKDDEKVEELALVICDKIKMTDSNGVTALSKTNISNVNDKKDEVNEKNLAINEKPGKKEIDVTMSVKNDRKTTATTTLAIRKKQSTFKLSETAKNDTKTTEQALLPAQSMSSNAVMSKVATPLPSALAKAGAAASAAVAAFVAVAASSSSSASASSSVTTTEPIANVKTSTNSKEGTITKDNKGTSNLKVTAAANQYRRQIQKYDNRAQEILSRINAIPTESVPQDSSSLTLDDEQASLLQEFVSHTETKMENSSSSVGVGACDFHDEWVVPLSYLLQGSRLSLSELTKDVHGRFLEQYQRKNPSKKDPDQQLLHLPAREAVAQKIKIIATRKAWFGQTVTIPSPSISNYPATAATVSSTPKIDRYEDCSQECVWRWELVTVDLLPEAGKQAIKKARSYRRKLSLHYKAIGKILDVLHKASATGTSTSTSVDYGALITQEEEKVLRYEREEEKARIAAQTKAALQQQKNQRLLQKEEERRQKLFEKEEEKRLKLIAKVEEKNMKLKAKEEEKIAKEKERKEKDLEKLKVEKEMEEKREKEKLEEKRKVEKRKKRMMSFFGGATDTVKKRLKNISTESDTGSSHKSAEITSSCHDTLNFSPLTPSASQTFRLAIDSASSSRISHSMPPLSKRALNSMKRKTSKIRVSVVVTSPAMNSSSGYFGEELVYSERKVIEIPNKLKHLQFHEDLRPPYRGTWSKPRSSRVNGRKPFGKETKYLNYNVDSEEEWEEIVADAEDGESCASKGVDDEVEEEEGVDSRMFDFSDGWLKEDDDDLSDDGCGKNDDINEEEDLKLKNLQRRRKRSGGIIAPQCVLLSPKMGGISPFAEDPNLNDATITAHFKHLKCHVLASTLTVCLNAFPPPPQDDKRSKSSEGAETGAQKTKPQKGTNSAEQQKKEMSQEDLRTFCRFVHNSNLTSRDKVVDTLRMTYPTLISSRIEAIRKLDTLATKRRIMATRKTEGKIVWEIRKEVLEQLGLKELIKEIVVEDVKENVSPSKKMPPTPQPQSQKERKSTIAIADSTPVKLTTKVSSVAKNETKVNSETTRPTEELLSTSNIKSKRKATDDARANTPVVHASANLFQAYFKKSKPTTSSIEAVVAPSKVVTTSSSLSNSSISTVTASANKKDDAVTTNTNISAASSVAMPKRKNVTTAKKVVSKIKTPANLFQAFVPKVKPLKKVVMSVASPTLPTISPQPKATITNKLADSSVAMPKKENVTAAKKVVSKNKVSANPFQAFSPKVKTSTKEAMSTALPILQTTSPQPDATISNKLAASSVTIPKKENVITTKKVASKN